MNYPEQQMLKILNRDLLSNPMYVINNLHIYDWESDFLAITRSLYAYEVEVKMSKQDFFNDFKKDKKHKVLKDGIIKVGGVISYPPNYFYYACLVNVAALIKDCRYATARGCARRAVQSTTVIFLQPVIYFGRAFPNWRVWVIPVAEMQGFHTFVSKNPVCFSDGSMSIQYAHLEEKSYFKRVC